MTVLDKIKSFFIRPKATVKVEQPEAAKAVEAKPPEKKADETSQQQSAGTT